MSSYGTAFYVLLVMAFLSTLSAFFFNIWRYFFSSLVVFWFGLNIFYSSQDMVKDWAEQEAMFSPLHFDLYCIISIFLFHETSGNSDLYSDSTGISIYNYNTFSVIVFLEILSASRGYPIFGMIWHLDNLQTRTCYLGNLVNIRPTISRMLTYIRLYRGHKIYFNKVRFFSAQLLEYVPYISITFFIK